MDKDGSTAIDIIVTTGSKNDGISGFDVWRKRLIVRIKEKPIEGRANAAIARFFSEVFSVPTNSVRIVSGEKSSQKTIEVERDIEGVMATLRDILGQD